MSKKAYFVISLILAVCALAGESVSKSYISRSVYNLAKQLSLQEKMSEADKIQANVERDRLLHTASFSNRLGMIAAFFSLIFWIVSGYCYRKRVWLYTPLILLVFYLLLLFMMV